MLNLQKDFTFRGRTSSGTGTATTGNFGGGQFIDLTRSNGTGNIQGNGNFVNGLPDITNYNYTIPASTSYSLTSALSLK